MVKAFAPGNISCIFSIVENKNPAIKGSLGVGFTVNKGVIVSIKRISKNKSIILFNNKKINFPTVKTVLKKLNKKNNFKVKISSDLPLGCGFGLSGASTLATAYALNKSLKLKKSRKELAKIAHIAEVENKTGLGDVVNQFYGGFLIKFKPSSKFIVKKLPIRNRTIYYKIFNKLDTKKIITNKKIKKRINKAGIDSLKKIKKSIKNKNILKARKNSSNFLCPKNSNGIFMEIIKISKEFSINSGLLKNNKVKKIIKNIEKNNGNASMIMLGNAVFSNIYFKGSKKIKITDKGACLL